MRYSYAWLIIICVSSMIAISTPKSANALSEKTHFSLNEKIAKGSLGNYPLDSYLKASLSLKGGVNELFQHNEVFKWIRKGGYEEDMAGVPYARSLNHFHDPIKSWNAAGYDGPLSDIANVVAPTPIRSSAVWAQATDQYYGDYSWVNARDYFYDALTAQNNTDREKNYADTFLALGHVMHLVQDASVPAHVRNDGHKLYNYETWVVNNSARLDEFVNSFAVSVSPSIFSTAVDPLATTPIAGLIDSNKYTGSNPGITTGTDIGLAEYANANFFSEDTTFRDYPYPKYSSTEIMNVGIPGPNGTGIVQRPYYVKARDGDSDYYLLATVGYLFNYVHNHMPASDYVLRQYEKPALDECCYDNYARKLLPRAVAYSSELLRYFFRGSIEAVDAQATHDTDGSISGMKMKVKNATPNEGMADGDLVVSCRYKPDGEAAFHDTRSEEVHLTNLASDATSDSEYTFEFADPIPSNATGKQYTLVYRGQLGAEAGAVAAKAFKTKSLVIDDWESGQNWLSNDGITTLSSETQYPYEGNNSLIAQVGDGFGSKLYESANWANTDFPPSAPIGLSVYYAAGNQNIAIQGGQVSEISNVNIKYHTGDNYTGNIYCIISNMPSSACNKGVVLDQSHYVATISDSVNQIASFKLPGTFVRGPFQFWIYSTPLPIDGEMLRTKMQSASANGPTLIRDTANGFDCAWNGYEMVCQIYGGGLIAYREFENPIDCSGMTKFKVTLKSNLSSIDFYYGEDYPNIVRTTLSTTNEWNVIEVPISDDVNKESLRIFGFSRGSGGWDENSNSISNTIYIDQLEAE